MRTAAHQIRMYRSAALGTLCLLPALCLLAQESPPSGEWIGRLDAPGTHLHLVLHVTRLDDGTLKGTLDSPDEGVKGAALEEIRLDLNLVRFRCTALDAAYLGKLGGDTIMGTLKQRGFAIKLIFQRAAAEPPIRKQTLAAAAFEPKTTRIRQQNRVENRQ